MARPEDDAAAAGSAPPPALRLANPMSEAQAVLRRSLLPGLLRAADHALYEAKKSGRNGFATYEPAPPLAPEMPEPALRQTA